MAHLHLEDPSDEMTCPYDDTHRVRVSRFQYHLIKCGKNHPHMQLMKCPFNARHYLQKHQYQQHVATCPDSALVQRDIMYSNAANKLVADKTSGNCSLPQNTYSTEYSSGENWDDDPDPNATSFVFGRSRVNPTPDTAMPPLAPSMPTMPKKVVPSSIGIGRGRGIPMIAAAAKAPGESRRVNAPSLALFDVGISEPAGSANQQPAARVSSSQVSPAVRMPANQPLTAASTNQQAGGAPLRAPPGFENKVPNTHIANNVVKQKTGRTPMAQCITPFGIAKDSVNVDSRQSGGSTGMSSGSEATFSDDLDDGSADVGLQLRKLKKKLRQIEDLEAKQTHGMYLDREQLRKLDTKDELITMMANLELQSLDPVRSAARPS